MSEQAQQGKALLSIPHNILCFVQQRIGEACWLIVVTEFLPMCTIECQQDIPHSFSSDILQHTEQLMLNLVVVFSVAFCGCQVTA